MNMDEKLAKIYEIPFPAVILIVIFKLTILIKINFRSQYVKMLCSPKIVYNIC
jgi:hypothetical protein